MNIDDLIFKKGKYLALVLDEPTRSKLLQMSPAKFSKVICHHVTIEHRLTENKFNNLLVKFKDGIKANVIGFIDNDYVECFTVSLNDEVKRNDGGYYHITLSVEPPHKPFEASKLLDSVNGESKFKYRGTIELTGTIELVSNH